MFVFYESHTAAGAAAAEHAKEDLGSWHIQPRYEVRPFGRPVAAGHSRPEYKQGWPLKRHPSNRSTGKQNPSIFLLETDTETDY